MKRLASALVVMLSLSAATSFSQTITLHPATTTVFANYPASINCKETELSDVLKATTGQNINLSFSGISLQQGVVVNNFTKGNNIQYIAVKLPALNNAVLSISKRIDENNNTVYIGHIIGAKSADAYELKHSADGNYQFVKISLEKILPTCSQEGK